MPSKYVPQYLITLKSHVRDDARHHRAPSWQPSYTPLLKTHKLNIHHKDRKPATSKQSEHTHRQGTLDTHQKKVTAWSV